MTTRRTFLTAGGAATLVAAFPSNVHASTTSIKSANKAGSSSLHDTITTMCINTLKEFSTPGPQRSLINPGEAHAHLSQFFNLLESTGINAKIDTHIKTSGGFSKARGETSAPFSTKDLTSLVAQLKLQGVALSKNDVHTLNKVLNSRSQTLNFAHMVDTHGISKSQRAIVAASHPRATERWALYEKAVAQLPGDPSESKMLVAAEGEGGGQYYNWDPTDWWWWNDWQTWLDWEYGQQDGPAMVQGGGVNECSCLYDWPEPDDPTNYTIYTQDVLDANIANTFANGAGKPYNFCKVWNQLSGFTLGALLAYLRANPLVLEEVAFWMAVAPEAVLIMGILLTLTLIVLSGYC
jgi:hypothetical protein